MQRDQPPDERAGRREFTATGLTSGTTYHFYDTYSFYVTTAYGGTESAASGAVQVTRKLAAPTGLSGATIPDTSSGEGSCNSPDGPDCHIQLTWKAVNGADHYDVYREMISADEISYSYVATSYTNSIQMPIGAYGQWLASYEVKAVRSGSFGTSDPSNSVQLTIGDWGGTATDCYLTTTAPYPSGGSVRFDAWATCPNDVPYYVSLTSFGSKDNVELTNSATSYCGRGSGPTCTAEATFAMAGTHTYCTTGQMTIPISDLDLGGPLVTATVVSRCVTLSG